MTKELNAEPTATEPAGVSAVPSPLLENDDDRSRSGSMALYAITIFLSAFLLFQVQPLMGKVILPWFGGTPSVWTTCMLFFQCLLFGGYAYAHWTSSRLPTNKQVILHLVLLIAGVFLLPILPAAKWRPTGTEEPIGRILLVLCTTVGLPFFVLSSTGPLLQRWFSRTHPHRSPYRLYALSNVGSLLALISYPFVFDWTLRLQTQAIAWSLGYALFAALCSMVAMRLLRAPESAGVESALAEPTIDQPPTIGRRALWFLLAFVPSLLLLATTNQVCLDVASVPFLWVLPLTLYLLSFILCFDSDRWYARWIWMPLLVMALPIMQWAMWIDATLAIAIQVTVHFATLFLASMVCHGELVRFKPSANHLTSFYLLISAGGAAGGLFVGLVAPHVFTAYRELSVGLYLCFGLVVLVLLVDPQSGLRHGWRRLLAAGLIILWNAYGFSLAYHARYSTRYSLASFRNFYGVLGINASSEYRSLVNGRILHGVQYTDPRWRYAATTYYSKDSGVGRVMVSRMAERPRKVGLVGLGIGTLATYANKGDTFRFYEINPLVVQVAKTYFTYLKACRGEVQIKLGDARLTMDREQDEHDLDVIVLDAFSSDAIPMHLLTKEAFAIYGRRLAPGGVIAVHISNRHFELRPVAEAAADEFGLAYSTISTQEDASSIANTSTWVLVAASEADLQNAGVTKGAEDPQEKRTLWTDDYASLFRVLRTDGMWELPKLKKSDDD